MKNDDFDDMRIFMSTLCGAVGLAGLIFFGWLLTF